MWITNRYYKEFVKRTPKQKDAIRELKKDPNFESNIQINGININLDSYSNHPEYIPITSTIANTIEKVFSKNTSRESDTDTTTNKGTQDPAGSVGGILMNRRCGDKK